MGAGTNPDPAARQRERAMRRGQLNDPTMRLLQGRVDARTDEADRREGEQGRLATLVQASVPADVTDEAIRAMRRRMLTRTGGSRRSSFLPPPGGYGRLGG